MCLIIKKGATPKVAKEDIVCYKVLKKISKGDAILTPTEVIYYTGEPRYITPFRNLEVTDEVNHNKTVRASGRVSIDEMFFACDEVESGVIHTIKTQSEAKQYAGLLHFMNCSKIIYKCIIPKGTMYYSGKTPCFTNSFASYGSKEIKFVKEIPLI